LQKGELLSETHILCQQISCGVLLLWCSASQ